MPKYLAFDIPNTKKPFSSMRSFKCYNIWHTWTVPLHLWNGRTKMLKKKKFIHFLSFLLWLFFLLSLAFFFFLSLESPPLPYLLSLPLPFFFFRIFTSPFFFSFFHYFLCASLSLSLSPPRSLPLRSAVVMEFGLTDEVDWWRSYVSLASFFFFFFGCGFHVIWVV